MPPEKVGDLIFALILGVILGGRLGYCLFYKPEIFLQPLQVFQIWEGGLSFHGGLLGVVVAFLYFAKKHGVPGWRLCDSMALAVCPGIFAVRMANFINGELYGRIIREGDWNPPWAMRFPTDPIAQRLLPFTANMTKRDQELLVLKSYEDGTWAAIESQVPLRHPSQIYEGVAEGLILGLILLIAYRLMRGRAGAGVYGGIFLIGYGVMRFFIEYFRQPDDHFQKDSDGLGTVFMGFSMGQVLCFGMVAIGLWMAIGRRGKVPPPPPDEPGAVDPTSAEAAT
jgi:phosphatidylglycerol:prolipoprotein diacylglycerol transferase